MTTHRYTQAPPPPHTPCLKKNSPYLMWAPAVETINGKTQETHKLDEDKRGLQLSNTIPRMLKNV